MFPSHDPTPPPQPLWTPTPQPDPQINIPQQVQQARSNPLVNQLITSNPTLSNALQLITNNPHVTLAPLLSSYIQEYGLDPTNAQALAFAGAELTNRFLQTPLQMMDTIIPSSVASLTPEDVLFPTGTSLVEPAPLTAYQTPSDSRWFTPEIPGTYSHQLMGHLHNIIENMKSTSLPNSIGGNNFGQGWSEQ